MDETRVVLVDDQILFVESLKIVLEVSAPDIRVVGLAHDGNTALGLIERERPDLVLLDVRMGDSDGVAAVREIRRRFPEQLVIMLTTFDDDEYVFEALRNGAVGYLLKDIPPEELIASIRAARRGSVMISPSVARKLVAQGGIGAAARLRSGKKAPTWLGGLSRRERDILKLLAQGWSNRIIGERLAMAEQTVKNNLSSIYDKMGVNDRNGALFAMEEAGIGPGEL